MSSHQSQEIGAAADVLKAVNYVQYSVPLHPNPAREGDQAISLHASASNISKSLSVHSSSPVSPITSSSIRSFGDRPLSDSLHVHPFAHPSTRSISSGYTSPKQWERCSTPFIHSSASLLEQGSSRPSSSVSFIKMGKGSKSTRSSSAQIQGSGTRWGRVTDAMVQHARKGGSRIWRSLTRPALFSSAETPKDSSKISTPTPASQTGGLNTSPTFKQLPPRPAPYFYARHAVDSMQNPASSSNHGYRYSTLPASASDSGYSGENDLVSNISVDSQEIGSWKENRTKYIPTISEAQKNTNLLPSQRLDGPTRPLHIRHAHSEMNFNRVYRDRGRTTDLGPGVNGDPFAASSVTVLEPRESSSSSTHSLSPTTPTSTTFSSKNLPTLSYTGSSSGYGPKLSSRSAAPPLSITIPLHFAQWDSISSEDSITPVAHEQVVVSSPSETPSLTPDGLSFSHSHGTVMSDLDESPRSRRSAYYFSDPDTPAKPLYCYDESALEEGTSQEATLYEGDQGLNVGYATTYDVSGTSHDQQTFLVDLDVDHTLDDEDDGGEVDEVDDVFTSGPDLTSLKDDWPLPPRSTLFLDPVPGMSWHRVSPDVEYFKPGTLNTPHRRLRIIGGRFMSSPEMATSASVSRGSISSRLLHSAKSEPHLSSSKQLSSPDASIVVMLGETILDISSLPPAIILTPRTKTGSSVTLDIRAATRPALISFCICHADTSIIQSSDSKSAYVTLFERDAGAEDVMTISVGIQRAEPQSTSPLDPFGSPSSDFSVRLPMTLGDLAAAISTRSLGRPI